MVFNETIPRIRVPLTSDERRGNYTKPRYTFETYITHAASVVGIRGVGELSTRYRSRVGCFSIGERRKPSTTGRGTKQKRGKNGSGARTTRIFRFCVTLMGVLNLLRYLRIERVRQSGLTRRRYAKNNIVSLVLGRGRPVTAAVDRRNAHTFSCTRYPCACPPRERARGEKQSVHQTSTPFLTSVSAVRPCPCPCLCRPSRRAFSNASALVRALVTTTRLRR